MLMSMLMLLYVLYQTAFHFNHLMVPVLSVHAYNLSMKYYVFIRFYFLSLWIVVNTFQIDDIL